MTSDEIKAGIYIFTLGAGFGMITMSLSAVSQGLIGIPLGFAQINIKNFLKCGTLSGGTFLGLALIDEKIVFTEKIRAIFQ